MRTAVKCRWKHNFVYAMDRARYYHILILSYCYIGVAHLANGQLSCSRFTIANLGNTTDFSTDGLLPWSLVAGRTHSPPAPVKISNYKVLCDATGEMRDTSSYVSVLVQFQCDFRGFSTGSLADCDSVTNITRQYQYKCSHGDRWVVEGIAETLNPSATFQTQLADECRSCHDRQESPRSPIDPDTHCLGKYMYT